VGKKFSLLNLHRLLNTQRRGVHGPHERGSRMGKAGQALSGYTHNVTDEVIMDNIDNQDNERKDEDFTISEGL
jgi:hypothetical protein